jgi:hypothetical protein
MTGVTYPVLASAGSDRNLSRSLSGVVPVVAPSPSAIPPHPCSAPLDQRETARWKVSDRLPEWQTTQKHIQYPETPPGFVQ